MDGFLLVEEAFGESFPTPEEINSSSGAERRRLLRKCAELEVRIAEYFDHDAIFAWHPFSGSDTLEVIEMERGMVGNSKAIVGIVSGALWAMELITDHMAFAIRLADDRENLHKDAEIMLEKALAYVRQLAGAGADAAYVPNDQAFNSGPYFAPANYKEFVLPYAKKLFSEIRRAGMLGIYHTDGNIMPLLDMIMETGAHALQSIDPMAGMDIKEVKGHTNGRLALIGNVQCSLLQEGPEAEIRRSARYCLAHASSGSGYVFMASNSIFHGMPLSNYRIMQDEYARFVAPNL